MPVPAETLYIQKSSKSPLHESPQKNDYDISINLANIKSDKNASGIPPGTGNRALENTKFCSPQADKQNLGRMKRGREGVEFKKKENIYR